MFRRIYPDNQMQVLFNTDFSDQDLYIREIGHSQTTPGVAKGPWIRDSFILHYILKGQGIFNGCPVRQEQGFLIAPNEIHAFQADNQNPWEHCWIMFDGIKARKLLEQSSLAVKNQVFDCPFAGQAFALLRVVLSEEHSEAGFAWHLLSVLYQILAWHGKSPTGEKHPDRQSRYAQQAVDYIQANFYRAISVEDIAAAVNLSSKYLCKLFRSILGSTPQNYLIRLRISRAEELLAMPDLGIGEIARSVGYDNALYFSQAFRKHRGKTPTEHRQFALSRDRG